MLTRPKSWFLFVLIMGVLIGTLAANVSAGEQPTVRVRIPVCQEDERFLKGKGDFDGERWSRYVCVHQDQLSS